MSYDYTLFVAPGEGPMSTWPPSDPAALGSVDEVKARLATALTPIRWTYDHGAWFGATETLELQLTAEPDGTCRFITLRRLTRREVEHVCRALGLVAVDAQTVELIRP